MKASSQSCIIIIIYLLISNFNTSGSIFTQNMSSGSQHCTTWTYQKNNKCICGKYLHLKVLCDSISKEIKVLKCYCMTHSDIANATVVGKCLFKCSLNYKPYYDVTKNTSQLDEDMCGSHNREGQMCSKCKPGYGVAVYAYNNYCTECSDYKYNWLKYIAVAFLPLTLFYVIILALNVNTIQTTLNSYVLFGQFLTAPLLANLYGFQDDTNVFKHIVVTIYGIWNLDFGRSIISPFCLHPDLTAHQVIALDYLIAFYPLLLILFTYLLVKLHDKYRLVVVIWKPFYTCVRCIQKEWNIKTSLISVFATFILLSNVKLLNVSFDLISVPIILLDMHGNAVPIKYVYTNGSMEYLGKEHIPYFVLGIVILLVFNILPILLLFLYPFRWFQRFCSLRNLSLRIFIDAFQGCYKTSPRDYRCLSILPFIIRLVNSAFSYITEDPSYVRITSLVIAFISFFVLVVRPYKSNIHNSFEGLFYLMIALTGFSHNKVFTRANKTLEFIHYRIKALLVLVPTVIILVWLLHKFVTKSKLYHKSISWIKNYITRRKDEENEPLLNVY